MVHPTLEPKAGDNPDINKLYMWRCIVTMAHADGLVHDAEEEYLRRIFTNMRERAGMPDDHYNILANDLENAQRIEDLLPYINDPAYIGQIVYFARLLAYKDGDLHPDEKALLEKMHIAATDRLNMELIHEEVRKNVTEDMVVHEASMDAQRPDTGLFGLFDRFMVYLGIDLMDE